MPYIKPNDRLMFQEQVTTIPKTGGELQFIIADIINLMLVDRQSSFGPVRYSDLEEIMGALSGAQHEFYRKVVSVYEDKKIKENGPVYTTDLYL